MEDYGNPSFNGLIDKHGPCQKIKKTFWGKGKQESKKCIRLFMEFKNTDDKTEDQMLKTRELSSVVVTIPTDIGYQSKDQQQFCDLTIDLVPQFKVKLVAAHSKCPN